MDDDNNDAAIRLIKTWCNSNAPCRDAGLMLQQSRRCTYLVTEVDPSDKLLEQPQGSCLWQSRRLVHGLMPVYVVSQVAPCCILRYYGQVLRREEDFPELDDVGVVEAQALIEHLPGCYFHTAPHTSRARKALPSHKGPCADKILCSAKLQGWFSLTAYHCYHCHSPTICSCSHSSNYGVKHISGQCIYATILAAEMIEGAR